MGSHVDGHCPYTLTQYRQPNQNASDFLRVILMFIGIAVFLAVAGFAFRAWRVDTLCTIVLVLGTQVCHN